MPNVVMPWHGSSLINLPGNFSLLTHFPSLKDFTFSALPHKSNYSPVKVIMSDFQSQHKFILFIYLKHNTSTQVFICATYLSSLLCYVSQQQHNSTMIIITLLLCTTHTKLGPLVSLNFQILPHKWFLVIPPISCGWHALKHTLSIRPIIERNVPTTFCTSHVKVKFLDKIPNSVWTKPSLSWKAMS